MTILTKETKDINNLKLKNVTNNEYTVLLKRANLLTGFPILIQKDTLAYASSRELLEFLGFVEDMEYNVFHNPTYINPKNELNNMGIVSSKKRKYNNFSNMMNYKYKHNLSDKEIIKNEINKGSHSITDIITENKGYSFGVEIETSSGIIPEYAYQHLNMKATYDGSIKHELKGKAFGGEYVTGVLRGDSGFVHLNKILRELTNKCEINKTCSVHTHIGGFSFDKATIVALWQVLENLQTDIFKMFPRSRRHNDHCSPINNKGKIIKLDRFNYHKSVEDSYSNIVQLITLGKKNGQTINKRSGHPAGRNFGYNRDTPRYWWINFIPTLFNISGINGHTIEIRIHHATMNYFKIRNLILLIMGIVFFTENNKNDIMDNNYNFDSIMREAYPNKGEYLINYFNSMKNDFLSLGNDLKNEKISYSDRLLVPIKLKNLI